MILGRSGCRERLWQLPRALRAYVTLRASTCEGPCPLDVYFCFTLPWHSSSHPCTCIHTQTPKHVRTCIREHAHSHTLTHTYAYRHMHARSRAHVYIETHACSHALAHIYIETHACRHTHTPCSYRQGTPCQLPHGRTAHLNAQLGTLVAPTHGVHACWPPCPALCAGPPFPPPPGLI